MLKNGLLYCLFIWSLAGCKINYSTQGGPIDPNLKTISIDQFSNQASLGPSTIGFTFTEKLRDLFQSQTKLDLISLNGDLNYEGTISSYTIQPISVQGDQTAAQNRLTISVKVNFQNKLEEKKNFEQSFTRFADYSSSSDINSIQDRLIEEIFDQITQDIFDKTLGDW